METTEIPVVKKKRGRPKGWKKGQPYKSGD